MISSGKGKLLFILPALPDYEPYVYNYIRLAKENSVEFDVICWNRKGKEVSFPDNYYVYQHPTNDSFHPVKKMVEIVGFCSYVRRVIRNKRYRLVFTFTIADSVFLAPYLKRKYKGQYVFDIRDYSPVVKSRIFKNRFDSLLSHSAVIVISSEGFKSWLPAGHDYLICHNTDLEKIRQSIDYTDSDSGKREKASILTIGALRDFSANKGVIDVFAGSKAFHLDFVGEGNATAALKQYCEDNGVRNVTFYGRYQKEEEDAFVKECDMMNLIMSHNMISDYLMSNRFYLAARFRKPIIVNDGNFQAEQVKKYDLGLVVTDSCQMDEAVEAYWNSIDWSKHETNCLRFLEDVNIEQTHFETTIAELIKE